MSCVAKTSGLVYGGHVQRPGDIFLANPGGWQQEGVKPNPEPALTIRWVEQFPSRSLLG